MTEDTRPLNREEQRLSAVADRAGIRLRLISWGENAAAPSLEARTLAQHLNTFRGAGSDASAAANILLRGQVERDHTVIEQRDVPRLAALLDRAIHANDRDRRIRNGQIPSALSPTEAVTVMRMLGRR